MPRVPYRVPRGGIFGLLGPNGAGKTTTLRMILHVIAPDTGHIDVLGAAVRRVHPRPHRLHARGARLYPRMGVEEQLVSLAETKGCPRREARRRVGPWLELSPAGEREDRGDTFLSAMLLLMVLYVALAYRVSILMYGKRATLPEILRWMRN